MSIWTGVGICVCCLLALCTLLGEKGLGFEGLVERCWTLSCFRILCTLSRNGSNKLADGCHDYWVCSSSRHMNPSASYLL